MPHMFFGELVGMNKPTLEHLWGVYDEIRFLYTRGILTDKGLGRLEDIFSGKASMPPYKLQVIVRDELDPE